MATMTMPAFESHLAQRRNAPQLPFLQTSFSESPRVPAPRKSSKQSRSRSRSTPKIRCEEEAPPNLQTRPAFLLAPHPTPCQPVTSPKGRKLSSRPSLFNMFHKPNVERARGHSEQPAPSPASQIPVSSRSKTGVNKSRGRSSSKAAQKRTSVRLQKANPDAPSPAPNATSESNPPPVSPAQALREVGPGQALRSPAKQPWTPPPLFQAYPQSIIHATLVHADHCMRSSSRISQRGNESSTSSSSRPGTAKGKPTSRKPSNASINASDAMRNSGPRKVYALTTSGHLLQYTGDGAFDRSPELIMKLGPKSAAFASDVIPGKHWVLQVIQSQGDKDQTPNTKPKKSMFTRLLGTGFAAKRMWVQNMLLVFDDPIEMNSWMVALRKQITRIEGAIARPPTSSQRMPSDAEMTGDGSVPHRALTLTKSGSPRTVAAPRSPLANGQLAPPSPSYLNAGHFAGTALITDDSTEAGSIRSQAPEQTIDELQSMLSDAIPDQSPKGLSTEDAMGPRARSMYISDAGSTPPPLSPSPHKQFDNDTRTMHNTGDGTIQSSGPPSAQSPLQTFFTPASTPMHQHFRRDEPLTPARPSQTSEEGENIDESSKTAARYSLYPAVAGSTDASFTAPVKRSPTRGKRLGHLTPNSSPPPSPNRRRLLDEPPLPSGPYLDKDSLERSLRDAPDLPPSSPIGNAFAFQDKANPIKSSSSQDPAPDPEDPTVRDSFLQPVRLSSIPERRSQRTSVMRSTGPLPLRTSSHIPPGESWPLNDSPAADAGRSASAPDALAAANASAPVNDRPREAALQSLLGHPSPSLLESPTIPPHTVHRPIAGSSDPNRPLRRPDSLRIKTDAALFLSTSSRTSSNTSLPHLNNTTITLPAVPGPTSPSTTTSSSKFSTSPFSAYSTGSTNTSVSTAGTPSSAVTTWSKRGSSARQSTLVPVFRPPSVHRSSVMSSSSSSRRSCGSTKLRIGSPPKTAPPAAPLPMPPMGAGVGIGI